MVKVTWILTYDQGWDLLLCRDLVVLRIYRGDTHHLLLTRKTPGP